jgi:tripartite-type tricarboxylate transporter receptor subunit TctC
VTQSFFDKIGEKHMKKLYRLARAAVFVGVGVLGNLGGAQAGPFPDKEVTITVNYGPGGVTDLMTRELAREMETDLGKTVIIANRPGALGTLGPSQTARQTADGYQVGVISSSALTIAPHLMTLPYAIKDFDFIAGYGRFRYGVVVRADSPYKTIRDLVEASKTGKSIFFGSPSTPNSLVLFDLGQKTGGKFEQVSFKSGPDTMAALMGGHVEVIVPNPSDVMSYINAGKLRLLASAGPDRWPEFPTVPTLRESGYNVAMDAWVGLGVPKGTPSEAIARLQAAVKVAMSSEKLIQAYKNLGVDPVNLTGEEYKNLLLRDAEEMGKMIKAANVPRVN